MELFGKEIKIKTHNCSLFGEEPTKREKDSIMLYVRFKGCNAKCSFCEFQDDASPFNFEKYEEVLEHLKERIWVQKINMTGGEPTLSYEKLKKVVILTKDVFPDMFLVLNTNGLNLKKLSEDTDLVDKIDNIALSRHHYDDKINDQILGFKSVSTKDLKQISKTVKKWQLHVTCNIIKGQIDDREEAYKYLDWVAKMKIPSCSFVSLMPINEYCKEHFLDFNGLNLPGERFYKTKEWTYGNMCRCNNWVYLPKKNMDWVKVYTKNTFNPFDITTSLVFDGQNLKAGFSDEIIY
jgi:molybdenum cofactor biosynthesis enzyme MoaA